MNLGIQRDRGAAVGGRCRDRGLVVGLSATTAVPAAADERVGLAQALAVQPVTVVAAAAAADTYVVAEQSAQTFGTAAKLAASNWSKPWHSDVYLRFAVPQPPTGSRVASARVDFTFQKLEQQSAKVELPPVASTTWPETTTSYANRLAAGAVIATALTSQGATRLSFDVTSVLGNGSFATTNLSPQSAAVVHSREHGADGPRLVVDYTPIALEAEIRGKARVPPRGPQEGSCIARNQDVCASAEIS